MAQKRFIGDVEREKKNVFSFFFPSRGVKKGSIPRGLLQEEREEFAPRSIPFIIGLGIVAVVLAGAVVFFYYRPNVVQFKDRGGSNQPLPSNPELERQYEQQLSAILKPFWAGNNPTGIKSKILELHAPGKYLDLHLSIVLAFDLIEQGSQTADQATIEQGLEKLNQLKADYRWLE